MLPGNLVFYEKRHGGVADADGNCRLSPGWWPGWAATKVDAEKDPANLTKATDYGELLLKDGQVHAAVETLVKVYERKPAEPLGKHVKDRLFEALTDLLHIDFERASRDYLDIYRALCAVPDDVKEEQSRKAKYYRLVGQGREMQGNLVEAFQMYRDFGALPIHHEKGIASLEDPEDKVPVNVWLRGRIAGMFAKAKPEQREPLEAKIAEEWKSVEARNDTDLIRSFVGMFDIPFKVGREARIRLAEAIMDKNDRTSFLEAELCLHQVIGSEYRADAKTGGRGAWRRWRISRKRRGAWRRCGSRRRTSASLAATSATCRSGAQKRGRTWSTNWRPTSVICPSWKMGATRGGRSKSPPTRSPPARSTTRSSPTL